MRSVHHNISPNLFRSLPWIMLLVWGVVAAGLFTWSVEGDRELYANLAADSRVLARLSPDDVRLPVLAPSPLPRHQLAEIKPKPPAPGLDWLGLSRAMNKTGLDAVAALQVEQPPAVWEMKSFEVEENGRDFRARFHYAGGPPKPTVSYQAKQPVWIIDLPADWENRLQNDYNYSKGLVRRLAVGRHEGYLRLVFYLRAPHGGQEQRPVLERVGRESFTISLKGGR